MTQIPVGLLLLRFSFIHSPCGMFLSGALESRIGNLAAYFKAIIRMRFRVQSERKDGAEPRKRSHGSVRSCHKPAGQCPGYRA